MTPHKTISRVGAWKRRRSGMSRALAEILTPLSGTHPRVLVDLDKKLDAYFRARELIVNEERSRR